MISSETRKKAWSYNPKSASYLTSVSVRSEAYQFGAPSKDGTTKVVFVGELILVGEDAISIDDGHAAIAFSTDGIML